MFQGHLVLLKVEFFFENSSSPTKWAGEDPCSSWWRETWCFNFSFQNYYAEQPCYIMLEPPLPCNLIIGLWSRIAFSSLLHHQLSKYFALPKCCGGYGFRECGRWTLLLHLVFHEIKIMEPINHTPWFGCEDVCSRPLHFGYLSFWGLGR